MKHSLAQRSSLFTDQTSLHPKSLRSLSPPPISQRRAEQALENKWDPELLSLMWVLLSLDYKVPVILSFSCDLAPGARRLRGSSGLNAHSSWRPASHLLPWPHTGWRTCRYRQGRPPPLLIRFFLVAQAAQTPGQKLTVQRFLALCCVKRGFTCRIVHRMLAEIHSYDPNPPDCWVGIGTERLQPKRPPASFSLRTRVFFPVLTGMNRVLQSHSSP